MMGTIDVLSTTTTFILFIEIFMNDNSISTVAANAFSSCSFLRTVEMKRNGMTSLVANSFASLPQIRVRISCLNLYLR